ncbi:MAG: hypothetical protein IPM81_20955 [Saprospirales bacterium]|nr:hypothetical protein [Saprospirales bacterium]
MKQIFFLALLATFAWTGCSKSSDDNSNPANPQLSGTKWVVTYFWDKDKDETPDFNGYTFEFNDNGVLVVYLPGGATKTGQWTAHNSSNKLQLTISGTYPLDEMNDEWIIQEKTDAVMKLKDDNSTHLEELYFKKI